LKKGYEENEADNDELFDTEEEADTCEEAVGSCSEFEISRQDCLESWPSFEVTRKTYLKHDFEISDGWGDDNQVMNTLPPPRPRPGGGGGDGK
jgi:hypothetical protein